MGHFRATQICKDSSLTQLLKSNALAPKRYLNALVATGPMVMVNIKSDHLSVTSSIPLASLIIHMLITPKFTPPTQISPLSSKFLYVTAHRTFPFGYSKGTYVSLSKMEFSILPPPSPKSVLSPVFFISVNGTAIRPIAQPGNLKVTLDSFFSLIPC